MSSRFAAALAVVIALVTAAPGAQAVTVRAAAIGPEQPGYWMVARDGSVFAFGGSQDFGEPTGRLGTAVAQKIRPTPSGRGYWIVDSIGRVYAYGDARSYGQLAVSTLTAGETVSAMDPTPTGRGYWLFTTKGRVVAFGDAATFGDMSQIHLNGPVVDAAVTASGNGYWMVAADGGVFSFGDARFYGSMGGRDLNAAVMSLVPDPDGVGYWLVGGDGGVFAFNAGFRGSMGGRPLNKPVVGMVAAGDGYLMSGADGGVFVFSNNGFFGSLGSNPPRTPIVGIAALDPPRSSLPRTISGSGSTLSDPFGVQLGLTRFTITSPGTGLVSVWLTDTTGRRITLLASEQGPVTTQTAVQATALGYRLEVTAAGAWTVLVEQPRNETATTLPATFASPNPRLVGPFVAAGTVQFTATAGSGPFTGWLLSADGKPEQLLFDRVTAPGTVTSVNDLLGTYYVLVDSSGWLLIVS